MNTEDREFEEWLKSVVEKCRADRATIIRSLDFGRLTWRRDRDRHFDVKLQPEL